MNRTYGQPGDPIWKIGESNPLGLQNELEGPLDPRHPTPHNIITAVFYPMQRELYRGDRLRLADRSDVRNAIEDPRHMKNTGRVATEVAILRDLLAANAPVIIFCFGQFSYEVMRIAVGEAPKKSYEDWTIKALDQEFKKRMEKFDPDRINVVPLLHAIVTRDFLYCRKHFSGGTGNYFEYAGRALAEVLLKHKDHPRIVPIWM